MIKNTTRNQKLGWVLFILYLAVLVYFTFFAEFLGRVPGEREYAYNLELFKEIKRFYTYRHELGMMAFLINVVGNVVAFIPCGFFLPIVSRRGKSWYRCISFCFIVSLFIEITQIISRVGSFDVDDLLLNTIGGIVGYLLYQMVQRYRIARRRMRAKQ